jgi:hypothetical protein
MAMKREFIKAIPYGQVKAGAINCSALPTPLLIDKLHQTIR